MFGRLIEAMIPWRPVRWLIIFAVCREIGHFAARFSNWLGI